MTRLILFDLGDTLESGDVLRPGARETFVRGCRSRIVAGHELI